MKSLFKSMGNGIIFILVLPFWLVVFAFFSVYSVIVFLITFFTSIPAYLKGESVFGPSKLDVAAATKLAEHKKTALEPPLQTINPQPIVQPSTTIIFNTNALPPGQQPQVGYIQQDGTVYRQVTTQDQPNQINNVINAEDKND